VKRRAWLLEEGALFRVGMEAVIPELESALLGKREGQVLLLPFAPRPLIHNQGTSGVPLARQTAGTDLLQPGVNSETGGTNLLQPGVNGHTAVTSLGKPDLAVDSGQATGTGCAGTGAGAAGAGGEGRAPEEEEARLEVAVFSPPSPASATPFHRVASAARDPPLW